MKRKLIRKFLKKRVYGWDLRFTDKDHKDIIVVRFVNGQAHPSYTNDTGSVDIVDNFKVSMLFQIYYTINKLDDVSAFLKAREFTHNRKGFKLTIGYKLKEFKNG